MVPPGNAHRSTCSYGCYNVCLLSHRHACMSTSRESDIGPGPSVLARLPWHDQPQSPTTVRQPHTGRQSNHIILFFLTADGHNGTLSGCSARGVPVLYPRQSRKNLLGALRK